ncbi:ABC transporter C family member 12-like, partial [Saccoglossus kowalevskii]|uniref:ABC transporter C family member 12-like n=1 Tax=Saccoglossus kowalevskii TaxID=10224 RepID=A0ABM0MCC9_SACKO
ELIGTLINAVSGFSALLSCVYGVLQPSYVGLCLSYSITMSANLNNSVRLIADCEIQMNAVERVEHYTHIATEDYDGVYMPSDDWPTRGEIKLDNLSVKYAADLDPVLNDVTVHIKAGEK